MCVVSWALAFLNLNIYHLTYSFTKGPPHPHTHPRTHTQIDIWKREKARESLHCDPEELATLMEEDKELAERKLKAAVTGRSSTARRAPARGLLNPVIPCYSTIVHYPEDKRQRTKVRAVKAVTEYNMIKCFDLWEARWILRKTPIAPSSLFNLLFTGNDVVTLSSSFAARRWKFRVFVSAPDMQMRLQKENKSSRKTTLEFTHVSTHKSGHQSLAIWWLLWDLE